jgi:thioesterase III
MNNNRNKILSSSLKVRFQHCDPLGHLNNATYIDYFLNAREDQLQDNYDVDTYDYAMKTGMAWVVANHDISYLFPVKAKELILIKSNVAAFNSKSITVHFEMFVGEKKCAIMKTTFVHIAIASGKPIDHSGDWMNFLSEIIA